MIAIVASCKVHPKNAFETRCIESAEVIPKKVAKDEDFHFAASGVESSAFLCVPTALNLFSLGFNNLECVVLVIHFI